jgi:hypothetical protein
MGSWVKTVQRGARAKHHACGVQTAWTSAESPEAAVSELAQVVDPENLGQLLVFFSQRYAAEPLCAAFAQQFDGLPIAGCSTAGEITPAGFGDGSVLVVAFPRNDFNFVSEIIPDVRGLTVERGK